MSKDHCIRCGEECGEGCESKLHMVTDLPLCTEHFIQLKHLREAFLTGATIEIKDGIYEGVIE